jgi:pantoate--beta-alanine ligase
LSESDLAAAPVIYQALREAAALIEAGERSPEKIRTLLRDRIAPYAPLDYAEVVTSHTLKRIDPLAGDIRILASADFHGVHLFDNIGVSI